MSGSIINMVSTLVTANSVSNWVRNTSSVYGFNIGVPSFTSDVGLITIQSRVYGTSVWRDVFVTDGPSTHVYKYKITTGISNAIVSVDFVGQEFRLKVQTPTTTSAHEFEFIFRVESGQ